MHDSRKLNKVPPERKARTSVDKHVVALQWQYGFFSKANERTSVHQHEHAKLAGVVPFASTPLTKHNLFAERMRFGVHPNISSGILCTSSKRSCLCVCVQHAMCPMLQCTRKLLSPSHPHTALSNVCALIDGRHPDTNSSREDGNRARFLALPVEAQNAYT